MLFQKNDLKRFLLFFICCLIVCKTNAEDIKRIGVPYIQNHSTADYAFGNQNWSITRDKHGVMYFGNAEGLLSYDGRYWKQFIMPGRQIVRAVAADQHGRIYAGSYAEFGYWSIKDNRMQYTSLKDLVGKKHALNSEIWKIYCDGDKTIFQSTLPITVAVPMVATAVCATVFTALIPAAFSQSNLSAFIRHSPFIFLGKKIEAFLLLI